MLDYEDKNNNSEINEVKESNDTSESKIEIAELHENTEQKITYGAVYYPQKDGKTYTCNQYSASQDVGAPTSPENIDNAHRSSEKKKKRSRSIIGVIAFSIVLIVVFSALSAIAAAYLTYNFYLPEEIPGTSEVQNTRPTPPEKNDVYIDKTRPDYSTHTKEPGNLMTMEEAILAVKDSVVEITTERVQSGFGGYSQYVVSGAGSGVIISTGGYIITNHHVIEGASNIIVRLTDGTEYDATLIATDSKTDVAVIAITPLEGVELTTAVIGSSESLTLGQTVIAIGNPLGKLGGTVTNGIISSLAREIATEGSGTMTLLQTNAAVSPGNSGGGLFDLYGRLIGVVNAKSTGEGVEGISFAIPIDTAWDVATQLIDKGYVSGRPTLGITIKQIQYGVAIFGETYYQLVVADNNGNSDFKDNDIILGIEGIEVASLTDLNDIIYSHKIGDTITVNVYRNRKQVDIEVTLTEFIPQSSQS